MRQLGRALLTVNALLSLGSPVPDDTAAGWRSLAPGMDLAVLMAGNSTPTGNARISVLRIDPGRWDLEVSAASQTHDGFAGTAREWRKRRQFTAAINAGMFSSDHSTYVGHLRFREHLNSGAVNDYQSVAAFDPHPDNHLPRFRIFDLDAPGGTMQSILGDYGSAVQNLRLIKRPRSNRWSQQGKKWSEAALGEDRDGRILFIFSLARKLISAAQLAEIIGAFFYPVRFESWRAHA